MNEMKLSTIVWMFQNKGIERNANGWNINNLI